VNVFIRAFTVLLKLSVIWRFEKKKKKKHHGNLPNERAAARQSFILSGHVPVLG
jgi:hypothetical protein